MHNNNIHASTWVGPAPHHTATTTPKDLRDITPILLLWQDQTK